MKRILFVAVIVLTILSGCSYENEKINHTEKISTFSNVNVIEETSSIEKISPPLELSVSKDIDVKELVSEVEDIVCKKHKTSSVVRRYSFQFKGSTAVSYMKILCEKCDKVLYRNDFRGIPKDLSYLKVIDNGDELVDGEYFTITADVQYGSYISSKNRIRCMVDKDDIFVCFSVTFKEEYREQVDNLEKGDTITFYGKYSADSFDWTDCELITE